MAIVSRDVAYADDGARLTGVLFSSDSAGGRRPGILLIHGGAGLDDHARKQARRYAELGYTVLACDMYGEGVAGDRERVTATLSDLRANPDVLTRRGMAGLTVLLNAAEVDGRSAAVGFCFGGLAALTLARSGAGLGGVISMHGALSTVRRAEPGAVTAKVLVCHGASDPHVPMTDVVAFCEEMANAGADWQVQIYGGAVHGFTHDDAVPGRIRGVEYDPKTDRRSFVAATAFLSEVFSES